MDSSKTLIETTAELANFLSWIPPSSSLYLDLEGYKLGRYGTITFMAMLVYPFGVVRVIDVQTLGNATFTTQSDRGGTLKTILEDPSIQKCLWDVRGDADALWALYRVGLSGVVDVQLLENYSRPGVKTFLCGLQNAICCDAPLDEAARARWVNFKRAIKERMATDVFTVRPVEYATLQYCVNDVVHLPHLHGYYFARSGRVYPEAVKKATVDRLLAARSPEYVPHTPSHAYGPWGACLGKGDGSG